MQKKYFSGCKSIDEVKIRYKQLALKHHPDRGGDTSIMQLINNEYESIKENPFFHFNREKDEVKLDYIQFPEIINQVIGLKGIVIELCGNWLWLSGATYRYRKELKKIGFIYAGQKKFWYWRPNDYKSANRAPRTMEYIRGKYGSDVIPQQEEKSLSE